MNEDKTNPTVEVQARIEEILTNDHERLAVWHKYANIFRERVPEVLQTLPSYKTYGKILSSPIFHTHLKQVWDNFPQKKPQETFNPDISTLPAYSDINFPLDEIIMNGFSESLISIVAQKLTWKPKQIFLSGGVFEEWFVKTSIVENVTDKVQDEQIVGLTCYEIPNIFELVITRDYSSPNETLIYINDIYACCNLDEVLHVMEILNNEMAFAYPYLYYYKINEERSWGLRSTLSTGPNHKARQTHYKILQKYPSLETHRNKDFVDTLSTRGLITIVS